MGSVRSTAIPTTTAGKTADAAKLVVKPNAQTTGDATTASAPAAAAPARAAPTSGQKAGTAGRESRVGKNWNKYAFYARGFALSRSS